ncbi:NTF2-like protein [Lophiostoma macrostomum CBS 122681]|uniref:NTF2-like protein n=1 Tax=Lophiostoma macrostomum CBS 122681 TaxID=1314788 RepID=A0A6A6STU0_9PLEO|nr:NTF2-like protein [Lophiostoma macrostomum CBS 122681]
MSITAPSNGGSSFLSFNQHAPRLFITSTAPQAPEKTLLYWKNEGFDVRYLRYNAADQANYIRALKTLSEDLELGSTYGIVCYGDAATVVLKTAQKPMAKCCAIVAFYPTVLPKKDHKYPTLLNVMVHVASLSQDSPLPEECAWKCYQYDCGFGFADPSAKNYSEIEANLAWSRSLACMRRGFKTEVDLEPVVNEAWLAKYDIEDAEKGSLALVRAMTQDSPHVTLLPTLEGGVGRKNLQEFYREFFIPSLVDDFDLRLVSRTIGIDRVVDEMVVSFTHSDEVDWMLPGVPPTNKTVEIPLVSIVAVRGGKLVSEHMYWDQASVLVQIGLLDPKVVPKKLKDQGLKRLPMSGVEAAKQLLEPQQQRYNSLLRDHGLMDGLNGTSGVNGA